MRYLASAKDGEFDRSLRLPLAGQCRGTDARADQGEVVSPVTYGGIV